MNQYYFGGPNIHSEVDLSVQAFKSSGGSLDIAVDIAVPAISKKLLLLEGENEKKVIYDFLTDACHVLKRHSGHPDYLLKDTIPKIFSASELTFSSKDLAEFTRVLEEVCSLAQSLKPDRTKSNVLQDFLPNIFLLSSLETTEARLKAVSQLMTDIAEEFKSAQEKRLRHEKFDFVLADFQDVALQIPNYQHQIHGRNIARLIILAPSSYLTETSLSLSSTVNSFISCPNFDSSRHLSVLANLALIAQEAGVDPRSLISTTAVIAKKLKDFDLDTDIKKIGECFLKILKDDCCKYAIDQHYAEIRGSDYLNNGLTKLVHRGQVADMSELQDLADFAEKIKSFKISQHYVLTYLVPVKLDSNSNLSLKVQLNEIAFKVFCFAEAIRKQNLDPSSNFVNKAIEFLAPDFMRTKNLDRLDSFPPVIKEYHDLFNQNEEDASKSIFFLSLAVENTYFSSVVNKTNFSRAGILLRCARTPEIANLLKEVGNSLPPFRERVEAVLRKYF